MTAIFVRGEDGKVMAKPSVVYPHYFKVLGYEKVDQGNLETARLVFTQDLMEVLGAPLHLVLERDMQFALKNFEVGEPARPAIGSFYKNVPGTPASRLGII